MDQANRPQCASGAGVRRGAPAYPSKDDWFIIPSTTWETTYLFARTDQASNLGSTGYPGLML
eukprot:1141047-Pelagomonas_calceolata.AAC.4